MLDGLTFLHCRHDPRCVARVDKRFDGYHTLQLMTRGTVELFYDGRRHEMAGCWFWPCFPGPHIRFHNAREGASWEHRYVAFAGPRVARWEAAGLLPTAPQPVGLNDQGRFTSLFDELLAHARRTDPMGRMRAVNLLDRALLEMAERRAGSRVDRPAWLDRVLGALDSFGEGEPDYAALAAGLGMSLSTLRRHFHQTAGVALHTHRLNRRIAAARSLLGDSELPLKEVARRLGYRDVCYFSRQFTEKAGISPLRYRRSRQR